ncbi:MAG: GAF domain-containing protein [Candidatus Rokubacteria bacterium]|nr:GAF domain-containing protein [Candidatus Rokubacteria bacterium]
MNWLGRVLFGPRDFRDRQQAQLRASESRFRALLESAPDAIVIVDRLGHVVLVNGQAETLFGYRREELIGASVEMLLPEHLREVHRQHRAAYSAEPRTRELGRGILLSARRKDGTRFPAEISLSPFETEEGLLITAVVRDISERRRAEVERAALIREQTARAEAEAAHRRMAFLAEASTVLSASLDYPATLKSVARLVVPYLADWCAVDVLRDDRTLQRLAIAHLDPERERFAQEWFERHPISMSARYGIPNVLRTGKPELWTHVPDTVLERSAGSAEELAALRALGLRSVMIVPLATRDRLLGTITFVTAESERTYGEADQVLAEDLTQRAALAVDNARLYREAEWARTRAEAAGQRLRNLQAVTEAALAHLSLDELFAELLGRITRAVGVDTAAILLLDDDRATLRLRAARGLEDALGRGITIPLGRGFAGRIAAERRPIVIHDVASADVLNPVIHEQKVRVLLGAPLMIGDAVLGVLHVGALDDRRFTDDDVQLLQLVADRVALAIDRATVYQAERRARRDAEAANRMKDEFVATVSHELRTPLTAILGWARLLRSGRYALPPEAAAPLETIERNARAQARLVDDLLDVSRIITGRLRLDLRPTDLGGVIEAALDAVRPAAAAKAIALESSLDPSATAVLGDPNRLQQIVWNLLTNAVKFTPDGGRVALEVRRHGSRALVVVRDTGKGISAEFLPYIFERFRQEDSTATRAHGGLGLGLAIVRHLAEMHGGTVHAASPGDGLGSTFTVALPLASRDVAAHDLDASTPSSSTRTSGGKALDARLDGLRVLVVDDEVDSRETVAAMLVAQGADVLTAASAPAALETLHTSAVDVLVADIGMPGTDGYGLIRQVRALPAPRGAVAAVALTAYARAEDRQRARTAGYDAHIAKPVEPAALAAVIAHVHAR